MVGYTLLRIDEGVDTGPIFAQSGTDFDAAADGHLYIQYKIVADNLGEITEALAGAVEGDRESLDTSERTSNTWGQPRLSSYARWKVNVRQ
jgi:methionyl-tRNA formyltransferase